MMDEGEQADQSIRTDTLELKHVWPEGTTGLAYKCKATIYFGTEAHAFYSR
jgi:hypothetical protein